MASREPRWAAEATDTYRDRVRLFVQTVRLFSGLLDRSLWLHEGPVAQTDGHTLTLPLSTLPVALRAGSMSQFRQQAEDLYLDLEELLAHITFESEGSTRELFARQYAKQAYQHAADLGVQLDEPSVYRTARTVMILLERARVFSWWNQVYPGSHTRLLALHRRRVQARPSQPQVQWVVQAQQALVGQVLDLYGSVFAQAYQDVALSDVYTSARVALRVLRKLAQLCSPQGKDEPSPPSSSPSQDDSQGKERQSQLLAFGLSDLTKDMSSTPPAPTKASAFQSAAQTTEALQGLQEAVSDPEGVAPRPAGVKALEDRLERLQQGSAVPRTDAAQRATEDLPSRVTLKDFRGTRIPLTSDELATARRLRSRLFRVMSRTAVSVYDRGHRLNVPAYLERAVTRHDSDCFEEERSGRGFDVTLLIDMSGSMTPATKLNRCARVARVMQKALDLPFVRTKFRGFRSTETGTVDILRLDSAYLGELNATGLTPLHLAIDVVAREMKSTSTKSHLFVLTDGIPNYKMRSNIPIFPEVMHRLVRTSVERARANGTNVMGLFILGPDDDQEELDIPQMFGAPEHWAVLPLDFESTLLTLVTESFSRYWRSL